MKKAKKKDWDGTKETPVRIIPSKSTKHATETRVFAREIYESYCAQKGCRFKGQHARQGVCHTTDPTFEEGGWIWADKAVQRGEALLRETKEIHAKYHKKGEKTKVTKDYLRHLESTVVCAWANSELYLEELIRLRARVAVVEERAKTGEVKPTKFEKDLGL